MAIQDVIKRLIYQFSSTGADQVAADMGKVNAEQQKLAVNSENTTKASLDLEASFDKLERRFDTTIKAQQDYAKVQEQVNAAVAQHPELQERANNVLELAAEKFAKASEGADTYSKLLAKGREALAGFAAEGGAVGGLLGSFGPWGVAAAAGIGLVTKAFDAMQKGAEAMGNTAASMKSFADNTGLTITQIRGLNEAGAQVGMSADAVGSAMQKFTANLEAAHQGTGALYDGLRQIDKGLADQIQASHGDAQAFDIVAKAINTATDATTRMNIARAAFGKGGASMAGVAGITGDAGGMNAYADATVKASGVTSELISHVATLQTQNKALEESNKVLMAAFYAEPVLERTNQFLKLQEDILQKSKEIAAAVAEQNKNVPVLSDPLADPMAIGGLKIGGQAAQAIAAETEATKAAAAADAEWEAQLVGLTDAQKAETAATEAATKAKQDNTNAAIATASQSAANVAALGSAATATEIAQARIDALTASFDQGKISADIYSRAVQGVRDGLANTGPTATTAANTLGDLMRANEGLSSSNAGLSSSMKITQQQFGDAIQKNPELASALDRTANSADAAAKKAQNLADAQAAAAHEAAVLKQQLDNIDWEKYLLGMSNMAAGMSNFLAMGTGAPGQSSMPDTGTGGFLSGGFDVPGGKTGSSALSGGFYGTYYAAQQLSKQSQNIQSFSDLVDQAVSGGGIGAGLSYAMGQQAHGAIQSPYYGTTPGGGSMVAGYYTTGAAVGESDIESKVDALYQAMNAQTTDKATQAANLKSELAWLQSRPESVARDQQIASLQQSLDSLTKSTDSLNATNQDLLSPFYTQDPRTSHIGFRSQGMAAGGYVDVPGGSSSNDNMIATIPVASGERIYVDPMSGTRGVGGSNLTINISSPVLIQGNANKDDVGRTMFQNNQNLAKQLRNATQ